jgi:uncharacterized protein involved in response to NO
MAQARTTAQILRDYRGPALFSFGFRPFFLFAALWAAATIPLWIAALLLGSGALATLVTRDWHVHEQLFGYTGAVIVGYLTVAGANWTGRFPVAGRPIAGLLALWLAGRAAMLASAVWPALATVDASFLILFALALWREQLAARNWRSVAPCIVLSLLACADVLFHLAPFWSQLAAVSERMAIALVAFLIAMVGGRLVPSFTRNWMAQRKLKPEPPPYDRLDLAGVALAAAALLAWVLLPTSRLSGALLLLAGAAALVRLLRWRGWTALSEPMVWILHAGYAWLALGLALLGLSIVMPGQMPVTAAIHALTAGAIGVMTLAVMTRTSRSHTGRAREADAVTVAIYLLINGAAALRVAASLWMARQFELLTLAAAGWTLAFGLFVLGYGPMLSRPWVRRR